MAKADRMKGNAILTGDQLRLVRAGNDIQMVRGVTRREFVKYSLGALACLSCGSLITACGSDGSSVAEYPIDSTVVRTTERVLSFPIPAQPTGPNSGTGLYLSELSLIQEYPKYGYGNWQYSTQGLPIIQRFDIMPDPAGYAATAASLTRLGQFVNFFTISDIHITDKEAPNQFIYLQQEDPKNSGANSSIYSPVMMCTTHVLDAAMQTANALHKQNPFDFAISLGDTCNSTSYNELRWYIDVIDGKVITPSSGAHLGAGAIDYQKPYRAAGLDKSIPWYQTLGNHDHFFLGSFPVDADPSLGLRESYISGNVWAVADFLIPDPHAFPVLADIGNIKATPQYYGAVLDGATATGAIIDAGAVGDYKTPPTVAADPNRRSLLRMEWIREFFKTSTSPVGHGFDLVDPSQPGGFACYSFAPKPDVPLKVIVLDNTQSETDGSTDIHGRGFLDANRWAWLQAELAAGQAANQLMIIAAHIPIAVSAIGSGTEWWESDLDPNAREQNAVTLTGLVSVLQNTPNLLMLIAGHRHRNTVKAFASPDPVNAPEKGFWQVETSSLRDFPQQLRTFEIYLNSDYTVSIVTINVDSAIAEGMPSAKSRYYSVATQQIIQENKTLNAPNIQKAYGVIPVDTMDPTRPQDGSPDPTIFYGTVPGVPYCASYNAELFKQLSPTMVGVLREMFPNVAG